jgi:hypothetical protein
MSFERPCLVPECPCTNYTLSTEVELENYRMLGSGQGGVASNGLCAEPSCTRCGHDEVNHKTAVSVGMSQMQAQPGAWKT